MCDWVCYVLVDDDNTKTYCGVSNNLKNRLACHNGEKKGGAKATKGKHWSILFHVYDFDSKNSCMSFEYKLKHHKRLSSDIKENREKIMLELIKNTNLKYK